MSVFNFSPSGKSDLRIVACLDHSAHARSVLSVAAAMARSLDRRLVLFHVVEPDIKAANHDPLDWSLQRCQARRHLERLAGQLCSQTEGLLYDIAEGECVQEIVRQGEIPGTTLVLGTSASNIGCGFGRQTAKHAVEAGAERVIIVPPAERNGTIETILVPLDGSGCCEAALVEACQLAEQTGASLNLVHVVLQNALALFGPPETDDLRLRGELDHRNQDCAARFIERTQRRLTDRGLKVRATCLVGEPRTTLARIIADEKPGLVIMSTRGQGGRQCCDLAVGSTTSYLLDHAVGPMLLLQPTGGEGWRMVGAMSVSARTVDPTLAA